MKEILDLSKEDLDKIITLFNELKDKQFDIRLTILEQHLKNLYLDKTVETIKIKSPKSEYWVNVNSMPGRTLVPQWL